MKKVAIVTGASRGIGAAIAGLLAEDHAICINYKHSKEQAEESVRAIQNKNGRAIAVYADVTQEQDIINLFDTVDRELGCVTTLINNAGINNFVGKIEETNLEHLQTVFSTNVFSTFIACKEAIKRMKKNNGGNIINISSEAAKFGGNHIAAYAASKAAINTLTMALAREVARDNIRVNAISPGIINTEMHGDISPERMQQLLNSIPLGRMGHADEVAQLAKWLVSNQASYISGAIVPVTGAR